MSLLPALFRQPDMPMALGRKIEKPVAKPADPIAAFERGDHTPSTVFVAIDPGSEEGDHTMLSMQEWFSQAGAKLFEQVLPYPGYESKACTALETGASYGKRNWADRPRYQSNLEEMNRQLLKSMIDAAAVSPGPRVVISAEHARDLGLKVEQTVDVHRQVVTVKAEVDPIRALYAKNINREYDEPWAKTEPALTEEEERQRFTTRFGVLQRQVAGTPRAFTVEEVCKAVGVPFAKLSLPDLRRVLTFVEDWVKVPGYGSAGAFA